MASCLKENMAIVASLALLTRTMLKIWTSNDLLRICFHLLRRTSILDIVASINQCFVYNRSRVHSFNGGYKEVICLKCLVIDLGLQQIMMT